MSLSNFRFPVVMEDGSLYHVTKLLGDGESNVKLGKSDKAGTSFLTHGLSLAPSTESGFNLCTSASPACIKSCIYTSGQAKVFKRTIIPARLAKSRFYKMNKDAFVSRLILELESAERKAKKHGMMAACRLNVFSDIMWEREVPEIYARFPNVQFYDYTKHYLRMLRYIDGALPRNLHLTFSWSGENRDKCLDILARRANVAVPFQVKYWKDKRDPLPAKFLNCKVIDGDITDLRFLDPKGRKAGYVVGLRAKGEGKKDRGETATGFVVPVATVKNRPTALIS